MTFVGGGRKSLQKFLEKFTDVRIREVQLSVFVRQNRGMSADRQASECGCVKRMPVCDNMLCRQYKKHCSSSRMFPRRSMSIAFGP